MTRKPRTSHLSQACLAYFDECRKLGPEQAHQLTDPSSLNLLRLQSNVFAAYFSYLATQNVSGESNGQEPVVETKNKARDQKNADSKAPKSTSQLPVERSKSLVNRKAFSRPKASGTPVDESTAKPLTKVDPQLHIPSRSKSSLHPEKRAHEDQRTVSDPALALVKEMPGKRKSPNHFICIRISNLEIHKG